MRRVSLVVRFHNEIDHVERALANALEQTYRPLSVEIVCDGSGKEMQKKLAHEMVYTTIPEGIDVTFYHLRHVGAWGAFKFALESAMGDYLAFLDADNTMHPDRIRKTLEMHPHFHGICAGNVNVVTPTGMARFLPDGPLDFHSLLQGNRLDTLNLMIESAWAKTVLAPAMQKADETTPGEKFEDYFAVLLAAKQGISHVGVPCGEYRLREGSRSRSMDAEDATTRTVQAILSLP